MASTEPASTTGVSAPAINGIATALASGPTSEMLPKKTTDSGSSASAYLTGGYGNLGGYLNTVWGRPVPNAIVFVPKLTGAVK